MLWIVKMKAHTPQPWPHFCWVIWIPYFSYDLFVPELFSVIICLLGRFHHLVFCLRKFYFKMCVICQNYISQALSFMLKWFYSLMMIQQILIFLHYFVSSSLCRYWNFHCHSRVHLDLSLKLTCFPALDPWNSLQNCLRVENHISNSVNTV